MIRNYEDWLERTKATAQKENKPIEFIILNSFTGLVEQYVHSPNSLAARCATENALKCVKKYLKEKDE